jgi:DNA-binding XRE family transcriptional regulator
VSEDRPGNDDQKAQTNQNPEQHNLTPSRNIQPRQQHGDLTAADVRGTIPEHAGPEPTSAKESTDRVVNRTLYPHPIFACARCSGKLRLQQTHTLVLQGRHNWWRRRIDEALMNTYETNQADKEEDTALATRVRGARAVRRQPAKLTYGTPHASSIPRVAPVGYESPDPDTIPSTSMRNARTMRGLSIRELSRRSGISPSTIYRIEQGKTGPRPHVARAISAVFACSPWEITEFREVMAATSLPR